MRISCPATSMFGVWLVVALVATHIIPTPADMGTYGGGPPAADYVVIGGGTAGCTLAARLCEALPDASVVVLERAPPRGPDDDLVALAPRLTFEAWHMPGLAEVWQSEPNEAVLPRGTRHDVITGRTLGGSSAINAAQWTKPPLDTVAAWGFSGAAADGAKFPHCR